jgi:hypothetical protein
MRLLLTPEDTILRAEFKPRSNVSGRSVVMYENGALLSSYGRTALYFGNIQLAIVRPYDRIELATCLLTGDRDPSTPEIG